MRRRRYRRLSMTDHLRYPNGGLLTSLLTNRSGPRGTEAHVGALHHAHDAEFAASGCRWHGRGQGFDPLSSTHLAPLRRKPL